MSPRAPHRFYYAGHLDTSQASLIELGERESHHLLHVLRLRDGADVDIFDAAGRAFHARVAGSGNQRAQIEIGIEIPLHQETLTPQINIAIVLIKRRPMDWLIEKLSELGVAHVQPLLSKRCVALGDVAPFSEPPERWDRIALAAAKQCGRNQPMQIFPVSPLRDWVERPAPTAMNAFAHFTDASMPLGKWVAESRAARLPLWIAIGPEGGWTAEEAHLLAANGYAPLDLGGLVLRAETAALAAASVGRFGAGF